MTTNIKESNRSWKAGKGLGEAIVEMVHLMYQNRTALTFIQALSIEINAEYRKRERSPTTYSLSKPIKEGKHGH